MKILVIEDSPLHQEAARILMPEHDVNIIDSFISFYEKVRPITANIPEYCKPAELDLASFDAVLTDVNLPSHHSDEAATGFVIALQALAVGVKRVGIITDANHHRDSYGRAFDLPFSVVKVNDRIGWGTRIAVGDARIAVECRYATTDIGGGRYGKNWKRLLDILSAD
ncbi:hypothetical protein HYW67_01965 [Candidatus Parcubacteria bacterium]|nr:hypothetical protein [Candidatus Parcubacteria bacterium]